MSKVASNSLIILNEEVGFRERDAKNELLFRRTLISAWFHDVADHKYDDEAGTLQKSLADALDGIVQSDAAEHATIMKIIERVSYSKEERVRKETKLPVDWLSVFAGDETAVLARHIVSDADKLEAIGAIGIERCREYTEHNYLRRHPGMGPIPQLELFRDIVTHADEKLLRLKDEYMFTSTSKRMAEPLHREMEEQLEPMRQQLQASQ